MMKLQNVQLLASHISREFSVVLFHSPVSKYLQVDNAFVQMSRTQRAVYVIDMHG